MKTPMKRSLMAQWESVETRRERVARYWGTYGGPDYEYEALFSLCPQAIAMWFKIPKGTKEMDIVHSKRKLAGSYKMRVTNNKSCTHSRVKVYDPVAEKWRGHHIYHRAWKYFNKRYGDKIFYTRVEV